MPKVSEEHRQARRDEIARAALACFARKGYQRTSMADIIAESGLSAGAIYGHYASKKELFVEVAGELLSNRQSELDERARQGAPLSPGQIMATLFDGLRNEPVDPRLLLQLWGEACLDDEINVLVGGFLARLRATIHQHVSAWIAADPARGGDDPERYGERLAPVLLALGPGFMLQRALVDDFDEDDFLAMLPEVLPG